MTTKLHTACYGWRDTEPTHAHRYLTPAVAAVLKTHLKKGASVLDIGCGNGHLAGVIHGMGFSVTAVDASPDGIGLAQLAYPGVRFLVGSVYDDNWLQTVDAQDAVLATEVLEHLYEPRALLRIARRVLRPEGILVLTVPYHGYVKNLALSLLNRWDRHLDPSWDGGHIKFFSRRSLTKMVDEEGFRVREVLGLGRIPTLWKSLLVTATVSEFHSTQPTADNSNG